MQRVITYLKSRMALILVALVWGSLLIPCIPLMIVSYFYDKNNPKITWLYSLFLGQDKHTAGILTGDHEATISAFLGFLQSIKSRGGTAAAKVVDWLFLKSRGEVNHCKRVFKESKREDYNFSARRAIAGAALYFFGLYLTFKALQLISAISILNSGVFNF